jgi:hypothetical protein
MTLSNAAVFGSGLVAMGFAVAALFFVRFWWRTRDGLFLAFGFAFVLMALNQGLPALLDVPREEQSPFYLLRLAAFILIILAIIGKNMKPRDP